jgi:DNA polymerase
MGYAGWINALLAMGAVSMGIKEEELADIAAAWREASPNIVKGWAGLESMALRAVRSPGTKTEYRLFAARCTEGSLRIRLPSGRILNYPNVEIGLRKTPWGAEKESLSYMAMFEGRWQRCSTYGGSLTENVCQAIAADIMANGMLNCDAKWPGSVVGTVHDEAILDVPKGTIEPEALVHELCRLPEWAKGCPITAEGFTAVRYRK